MERVDTPAVVVDADRLEENITGMAEFSRAAGVKLRPHVKAHKIPAVARKQLEAGAAGITAARLSEAEVMVGAGIRDVLIAYPVVSDSKIHRLFQLAAQAEVTAAVDSSEGARLLSAAAVARGEGLPVLIEINSGLDRCGVPPGKAALNLAGEVAGLPGLKLEGLFTHAGHAYAAPSHEQVAAIGRQEGEMLVETAVLLRGAGIPVRTVSVGSTPTARFAGLVRGVTEIRPGNYVFYDAIQVGLGIASPEQCSLSVFATVISKPAPGRIVIDAGSKTLALDRGAHGSEVVSGFGLIRGYPGLILNRLSEEHGIIDSSGARGNEPVLGEQLQIIPNHACVVVNLADCILVVRQGKVLDRWPVAPKGP